MRAQLVEGIVIKRQNYSEADRILTLYTPKYGKLSVIAKGIRRPHSRRAGSVELFNTIRAYLIETKGDLSILTEVEVHATPRWQHHLGRINLAYQLCEVIDKLSPDRLPHPQLYTYFSTCLSQISDLGENWEPQFNSWLLDIIKILGYWPVNEPPPENLLQFIEDLAGRPLHSPKLLPRLKLSKTAHVNIK